MKMKKRTISLVALALLMASVPDESWAQKKTELVYNNSVPVLETDEQMETGPFTPDWESLCQYEVPQWFADAKFGIWAHWGPQCVEGSGDWMARGLYIEDSGHAKFHREHYGHPSEFGFKDVLPLFKAENWAPDELVKFYVEECGAQYFFAMANHHDNYDLWDSKYQEWNTQNIGPHRDVLGEWAAAARKQKVPFGISFHADHAWVFYEPSRRFDLKGEQIGVKYDGWSTKEDGYKLNADGTEKWWKGLDPQNLYQQTHDFSADTWNNRSQHNQWAWQAGACLPSQEFVTNFWNRTVDAIKRYNPDLIYYDATVLPFFPVSDCGLKLTAEFYNHSANQHGGKNQVVQFGKILNEMQQKAMVWDVEKGAPNKILDRPWQCCSCIGGWHYNQNIYDNDRYKSAATVAKLLVDIVSKNGNMLLSVPLRSDGTPDEKELAIMKEFGAWMKLNKESIVKTRPWKKFGEGPIADADIKMEGEGFNEGKYQKAGSDEVRFTQNDKYVYVSALGWPESGKIVVKSMAEGSELFPQRIKKVELIGYGKVKMERTAEALIVTLPAQKLNNILPVLKIQK